MENKKIKVNTDYSPESERHELFFQLYGNCQNKLYSFLYMMLHNENDAEDIQQETAAAMWEEFENFKEGTNFTAWAITIARNKAINFIKKNSRSRALLRDEFYTRITEYIKNDKDDYSDRASAMRDCVKKLEESDQKILKMRYDSNIATQKVAEILGRSKKGIYHTMARIHSVLHDCIKRNLASETRA